MEKVQEGLQKEVTFDLSLKAQREAIPGRGWTIYKMEKTIANGGGDKQARDVVAS